MKPLLTRISFLALVVFAVGSAMLFASPSPGDLVVYDADGTSAPTQFTCTGPEGGPFGCSKDYVLKNEGSESFRWLTGSDFPAMIRFTPANGQLAPNGSVTVTVSVVESVAATYPVGDHDGDLSFVRLDRNDANTEVPFLLVVE